MIGSTSTNAAKDANATKNGAELKKNVWTAPRYDILLSVTTSEWRMEEIRAENEGSQAYNFRTLNDVQKLKRSGLKKKLKE